MVDIKIELAVNPVAGMMMATNLLVKRNLDGTKNLQRFSDVAWILWREACKEENVDPGTSLKYVVHWSVANDKTQLVVGSVLGNLNLDVDDRWPGHTLDMNADAGHTVLGAPNGYGIGFMLKDYKKFFKGRTVLSATSYECEIPQAAD